MFFYFFFPLEFFFSCFVGSVWKKKWVECYLRLAGSVSGDILADMNVYQPLIFMVRVESRRGESERWTQPIYSGSVTSSSSLEIVLSILNSLVNRLDFTLRTEFYLIDSASPGWTKLLTLLGALDKWHFYFHFFFSLSLHPFSLGISLFMAGRSDGSAIKALFSPNKGDPPPQVKKKNKSPSSKNAPPPDQKEKSPFKKLPSHDKNAPTTENSPTSKNAQEKEKRKIKTGKQLDSPSKNSGRRLTPASKGHLQRSAGAWAYVQFGGSKARPKKKKKERCLSLLWINDHARSLNPLKTWFYVKFPAWA